MSRMEEYLYSLSTPITNQLFQQGLLPNQGLGKENKGRIDPIILMVDILGQDWGIFRRDH